MVAAMKKPLFFNRFAVATSQDSDKDEITSVIQEIKLLLNTRSFHRADDDFPANAIISYGLRDYIHLSPQSRIDAQILANNIKECITHFEPRLHVQSVVVDTPRTSREIIRAVISGNVTRRDFTLAPISFPVEVGNHAK